MLGEVKYGGWRCRGRRIWRFGRSPESGSWRSRGSTGGSARLEQGPGTDGPGAAACWPALGWRAGGAGMAVPSPPQAPSYSSRGLLSDPRNPSCGALWAARILGLELAWELRPVSVLPWANGPAGCLARVRSGG